MSLFRSQKLKKISRSAGHYERGKWKEGDETEMIFFGSWQPTTGQQRQLLPEGKRTEESWTCYAPISIEFATAGDGVAGDIIEVDEKRYEVLQSRKWDNGIIPHWELICGKVEK